MSIPSSSWGATQRQVRRRPSAYLDTTPASSAISLDELAELEDSVSGLQRKPSVDEFSRILSELGANRRVVNGSRSSLHRVSHQSLTSSEDGRSLSRASVADDDTSVSSGLRVQCCCGQLQCDATRRFGQQIRDLESDLQLSAEIGQALLKRQDALVYKTQQETEEHVQQRDQLLARLTQSIKDNQMLERQLSQTKFNLEAADQSHHALLTELSDVRQQLKQMKAHRLKAVNLETKLDYATSELQDVRHELDVERRRARAAECRSEQVMAKRCFDLSEVLSGMNDQLTPLSSWTPLFQRLSKAVPKEEMAIQSLMDEYESVTAENAKLRTTFDACRQEIKRLRKLSKARTDLEMRDDVPNPEHPALEGPSDAELSMSHDDTATSEAAAKPSQDAQTMTSAPSVATISSDGTARVPSGSSRGEHFSEGRRSDGTSVTTPSLHSHTMHDDKSSNDAHSMHTFSSDRDYEVHHDARTAQLVAVLEFVQRAYTKLANADIDTLAARLQRQKLAGDVSHLSQTTIQASVRDVENLREHFRRQVDREARDSRVGVRDTPDMSLVTRRDFFALIKLFREVLLEVARLRRAVNDVHLNPTNAASILHEQLQASMDYAPKGSWISRILTGALSNTDAPSPPPPPKSPAPTTPQESMFSRILGSAPPTPTPTTPVPERRRANALPVHMMPRASVAKPTPMAVQACGSQVSMAGSHFPQHMGARGMPMRSSQLAPPSRLRDTSDLRQSTRMPNDDAMHMRYGDLFDPTRTLRPRARGMSDSSIHSTYLEHAERAAPVDRVITHENLTLGPDAD